MSARRAPPGARATAPKRLRAAGTFGAQLWTSGLAANRANLERFIGFMVDQRLLERPVPVDALFHPSVHGT